MNTVYADCVLASSRSPTVARPARPAPRKRLSCQCSIAVGAFGDSVGGKSGAASFYTGEETGKLSCGQAIFSLPNAGKEPAKSKNLLEKWQSESQSLQQRLQALGVAGVAAYGLFNTMYYTGAFLFCWIYVANVPQGLGVAVAACKLVEVLGVVWAGSQVTKLLRAAGALALAPLVDKALELLQKALKLKSKQQAFWALVAGCASLAAVLFGVVVLVWA